MILTPHKKCSRYDASSVHVETCKHAFNRDTNTLPYFVLQTRCVLQLAAHAKIFVNDAFGAAHRSHASTVGVTKYMDHSVAGFLMEKELDYLKGAMDSPSRPFIAMIGGAKVSTKVG